LLVVYDPICGLVVDLAACENAHSSERLGVAPLLGRARPEELWIADRHFCTRAVLRGLEDARACFIVREYANHSHLIKQGEWQDRGRTETGTIREEEVAVADAQAPWQRIELALDQPTEDGNTSRWL